MARFTPDPTLLHVPRRGRPGRRPRRHAYVVTLNTGSNGDRAPDALTVLDFEQGSSDLRAGRRAARHARHRRRAAPLRLERVLLGAVPVGAAPARRAPLPARARPALARRSTSSTSRTTRARPRSSRSSRPRRSPARPATAARTRSTAAPTGSTCPRSATPRAAGRAASSCSTTTTSRVKGAWEADRGPQELAYDFWWHLGFDTRADQRVGHAEDGRGRPRQGELLLGNKYGHKLHVWDLKKRRHQQEIDLGPEHQMVLELRPAHDVRKAYGFVGVVTSTADLSASVWLWERADDGTVSARKVISIPAEPADADQLPPILQPFGAVPPLVTDISLSVDDRWLLVSCWGTGELKRYDVSDPRNPRETGSVHLGGIVRRAAAPRRRRPAQRRPADGRDLARRAPHLPDQLALRRLGRAVLPRGHRRLARQARRGRGRLADRRPGRVRAPTRGERPHQVRLGGGDASSDSYCFPD